MARARLDYHLRGTRRFGCGFAVLLAAAMAFVIFLGTVLGDCMPDDPCHRDDGASIGRALLQAVPIVLAFALAAWLIMAAVRASFGDRLGAAASNALLALLMLVLVWASLRPAFDIFFWLAMR